MERCSITKLLGNLPLKEYNSQADMSETLLAYKNNSALILDKIRKQKTYLNSLVGVFRVKSKLVTSFLHEFLGTYKNACSELGKLYSAVNDAIETAKKNLQ